MKDPRLQTLAGSLLDYSLELKSGERLLIEGDVGSRDLMIALVEETYRRGRGTFY